MRLIGPSKRARLLTVGTLFALVAAILAFIALPSDDEGIPQDTFTLAADRICVVQKQQIVATGQRALQRRGREQLVAYAGGLVPLAVEWRAAMSELSTPSDRVGLAEDLSLALRDVAVKAGALSRLARSDDSEPLIAQATAVDEATSEVEEAVDALDLRQCGELGIALVRPRSS